MGECRAAIAGAGRREDAGPRMRLDGNLPLQGGLKIAACYGFFPMPQYIGKRVV